MKGSIWFVAGLVVVLAGVARSEAAVQYSLTDLGALSLGEPSDATAINSSGQVVGYATDSNGQPQAFLYSGGSIQVLGKLSASQVLSYANGINNAGRIVGSSSTNTAMYGFIYSGGTMTEIPGLGGVGYTSGNAINNLGQTVGISLVGNSDITEAYLYSGGTTTNLGSLDGPGGYSNPYGINDHTQIAGCCTNRAFIWQNGVMTDLGDLEGGSGHTEAYAINNSGKVVGATAVAGYPAEHAMLWQNGVITDLGVLQNGSYLSFANAINDNGVVVGTSRNASSDKAFIWDSTDGMHDLNNLLDPSGAGWMLERANCINDAGQIVGYGINPSGQQAAFLLTPTPEPGTFVLLAAGGIGLLAVTWRRRAKQLPFVAPIIWITAIWLISLNGIALGDVRYNVTHLGTLGGTFCGTLGINSGGEVVGYSTTTTGDTHAFLYSGSVMTDLGTLATSQSFSYAASINNAGQIVGTSQQSNGVRPSYGFIYSGGTTAEVPGLGGVGYTFCNGINNAGQVVGISTLTDGSTTHAYLFSDGTTTDLGSLSGHGGYSDAYGINDHTQITGNCSVTGRDRGFIWQNSVMTDLGDLQNGAGSTRAYAINNNGEIVGETTVNGSRVGDAFLWQNGVMTDLGVLPNGSDSSYALAINEQGSVVGRSYNVISGNAFLWDGTNGMRDLNNMLSTPLSGWTLNGAYGINNAGQIACIGINSSGDTNGFLLTPTPEPGTFALLAAGAMGLVGYGFWRRRRGRHVHAISASGQDDEPALLSFPSPQAQRITASRRAA